MFAALPSTRTATLPLDRLVGFLIFLATLAVVAGRMSFVAELPLWIDETWSAMIANRPDWPSFWREAWLDCNPPLYYLFLSLWIELAGDSNLMLRLPSIIFVMTAAAVPLVWRPKGLNQVGTWSWSAFMLLWPFGVFVMLDARGYGLLFLLGTLSCYAMTRVLDRATIGRIGAWVGIGTLMFLTHYYAAALISGQVLVLLHRSRGALLRAWPAGVIAIPGLAWFAWHLPRLQDYARPDVVWYDAADALSAAQHLAYVVGASSVLSLVAIVVTVAYGLASTCRQRRDDNVDESGRNLALTAAAAAMGFVIATIVGMFQPSLTERYFVPLVPSAMLALALLAQRCPRQELAVLALAAAFAAPGLNVRIAEEVARKRVIYGIEEASDFLAQYQPDQLLFVWDHPAAKILDPRSLEAIGGYFLERGEAEVAASTLVVPENADANALIAAAVAGDRPAVIWLYNTARRSAAAAHPPALDNNPAWTCRHRYRATTNAGELGSIACVKLGDRP
jgi:hypothetical protein